MKEYDKYYKLEEKLDPLKDKNFEDRFKGQNLEMVADDLKQYDLNRYGIVVIVDKSNVIKEFLYDQDNNTSNNLKLCPHDFLKVYQTIN